MHEDNKENTRFNPIPLSMRINIVKTLTLDPGHGLGHSNNPTWRQWLRLAGSEAERIGCDESLEVAPATAKPCGGDSGGGTTMTEAKAAQQETGGNE